jgi:hypothetical protein
MNYKNVKTLIRESKMRGVEVPEVVEQGLNQKEREILLHLQKDDLKGAMLKIMENQMHMEIFFSHLLVNMNDSLGKINDSLE